MNNTDPITIPPAEVPGNDADTNAPAQDFTNDNTANNIPESQTENNHLNPGVEQP